MQRRIFAIALALGVAALLAPRLAIAEDHLAEAISHTKEAITEGQAGNVDGVVTHATVGLTHAELADNTFNVQRRLISARTHRGFRASAMQTWREVVAVA